MSEQRIQFRSIAAKDYAALENIIETSWNYQKFCTKKTAKALSRLYLAACLSNQTYTCVALHDHEPIGIIMGKNEKTHRPSFRYTFRKLCALFAMIIKKEGRQVLKLFGGFDTINKNLLTQSAKSFCGELAFFAVRSDQRGTGVGKELFNRFKDDMVSHGITDFYVYTDTTCNFGFYEHQGMKRLCEQKHLLPAYEGMELSFFLYGYSNDW